MSQDDGDICWQKFKLRFSDVVRDVIRFAKFIPGFQTLDLDDQVSLVKGGGFEVSVADRRSRSLHFTVISGQA